MFILIYMYVYTKSNHLSIQVSSICFISTSFMSFSHARSAGCMCIRMHTESSVYLIKYHHRLLLSYLSQDEDPFWRPTTSEELEVYM
jgi:hypothetical protein